MAREVKVVITADDKASGSLSAVGGRIRSLRDASEHAGKGLGRIGNILGDVSREALGATGWIGRVGEKLLEIGVGGGAFVLIAGGIAAIVALYEKLTKATKEAREETEKLFKATPAGQHEERVAKLAKEAESAKHLREEVVRLQAVAKGDVQLFGFIKPETLQRLTAARRELDKIGYVVGKLQSDGAVNLPEIGDETPEQKAARLRREAFTEAGIRAAEIDLRGAGGPRVVGGHDEQIRKSGLGGVDPGQLPGTLEDTTAGALSLAEAFKLVGEVTPAIAEGLDAINNSALASIPGFGIVAKAAQKAVQIVAKVEGAIAIAKGAVKVAESIWPFNPAGLASGTKMIAEGARLAALGGGGGGSGGGGGHGGGSSFTQSAQAAQQAQRDTVTVILPPIIPTTDPGVQDWLADVIRNASGRNVVFQVGN